MKRRRSIVVAAAGLCVALLAAGCGDDGGGGNGASGGSGGSESGGSGGTRSLDGEQVVALSAGDRNDHGFYEGQFDALEELSTEYGFDLTIVDKVGIPNAREAFENAARQNPAIILSTGSEIIDGFTAVCEDPQYESIFFMSVASFPPECERAVHYNANTFDAYYMTGVAAGLIMSAAGQEDGTYAVVAGPQLAFVENDMRAMEEGLKSQLPNAQLQVNYTGDFDNAALNKEAAEAFINQGVSLLFAYLAGGSRGVVEAANEGNVGIVSNSWDGCADPLPGEEYVASNLGVPGPALVPLFEQYIDGSLQPPVLEIFGLDTPGIGALVCNPTPEQQQVMDDVASGIVSGEINVEAGGYDQQPDGSYVPR